MKLEKFEQEFEKEVSMIKNLSYAPVIAPEFSVPSYTFFYTKALSLAFAVPALAIFLGFFFAAPGENPYNQNLAQIEESNIRILDQINTLDNDSNI